MAIWLPMVPVGTKMDGFAAEDFGGASFELVDRGIFAVDVVAYFGRGHGRAHGGRGAGDGVAAQIDYVRGC